MFPYDSSDDDYGEEEEYQAHLRQARDVAASQGLTPQQYQIVQRFMYYHSLASPSHYDEPDLFEPRRLEYIDVQRRGGLQLPRIKVEFDDGTLPDRTWVWVDIPGFKRINLPVRYYKNMLLIRSLPLGFHTRTAVCRVFEQFGKLSFVALAHPLSNVGINHLAGVVSFENVDDAIEAIRYTHGCRWRGPDRLKVDFFESAVKEEENEFNIRLLLPEMYSTWSKERRIEHNLEERERMECMDAEPQQPFPNPTIMCYAVPSSWAPQQLLSLLCPPGNILPGNQNTIQRIDKLESYLTRQQQSNNNTTNNNNNNGNNNQNNNNNNNNSNNRNNNNTYNTNRNNYNNTNNNRNNNKKNYNNTNNWRSSNYNNNYRNNNNNYNNNTNNNSNNNYNNHKVPSYYDYAIVFSSVEHSTAALQHLANVMRVSPNNRHGSMKVTINTTHSVIDNNNKHGNCYCHNNNYPLSGYKNNQKNCNTIYINICNCTNRYNNNYNNNYNNHYNNNYNNNYNNHYNNNYNNNTTTTTNYNSYNNNNHTTTTTTTTTNTNSTNNNNTSRNNNKVTQYTQHEELIIPQHVIFEYSYDKCFHSIQYLPQEFRDDKEIALPDGNLMDMDEQFDKLWQSCTSAKRF